jgi:hypothetical protein
MTPTWGYGRSTKPGRYFPPRYIEYIRFFHSHIQDLRNTRPVTDVGILRSFASIEFNSTKSLVSTVLFEQTLIQAKFPFGIVFDVQLKELSKLKVLVLANQDVLSDEQVGEIRRFVENGGGLVATEATSMRTEWRRKRDKFGLADILGIDLPPDAEAMNPLRREFGKGRMVYIPRIEPTIDPPPAMMSYLFGKQYWKLAKNHEELVEAVHWAGRQEFSVQVDAPLWVTMELAEQASTGTWLLHLLNFRFEEALKDIPVEVRLPQGRRLREAVLESPDGVARQVLKVTGREGAIAFNVPELKTYDLILLRMEGR